MDRGLPSDVLVLGPLRRQLLAVGRGVAVASRAAELRPLIGAVYVPGFLAALGTGMALPVLPLFAQSPGASIAATGSIVALVGVGTLAADVPAGVIVARLSRRAVMLGCSAVGVVLALLASRTSSVSVLAVLMLTTGVFHAIFFLSRLDYVRHVVPAGTRGVALAVSGGRPRSRVTTWGWY